MDTFVSGIVLSYDYIRYCFICGLDENVVIKEWSRDVMMNKSSIRNEIEIPELVE